MSDPVPQGPSTIIGVGASAGGVEALSALMARLPYDLDAAVLVVLHVSPAGTSVLPQILDRAGPLTALAALDGEPIRPSVVYVAPPDRHLTVEGGCVRLTARPRENGHRPAIDPLFRSIAAEAGRPIGVVLSGTRDDGTQGMASIKAAGGLALVQEPAEALYDGMPCSTIQNVDVDAVLPVAKLATALADLVRQKVPMTPDDPVTSDATDIDSSATRYTCPDCGGALWRSADGGPLRFVCSVGHAYSPDSLDGEQAQVIENALWAAARLLGDRATLLEELALRAERGGLGRSASAFRANARDAVEAADTLRGLAEAGRIPASPSESLD